MASTADKHFDYYWQVRDVYAAPGGPTEDVAAIEDWGADCSDYDAWAEDPERYERDRGHAGPGVPLQPWRRTALKEQGFHFKRDGGVLYQGVPAREWIKRQQG